MNEDMNRAADICDAIGAFFATQDFAKKIEGKNMFEMASFMMRETPNECLNLIKVYHGIDTEGLNAKDLYARIITAIKGTTDVFQRFE